MNVKNFILGIAIIVVTIFVVVYGFSAFYPEPQFNHFCNDTYVSADNEHVCDSIGGKWTNFTVAQPAGSDKTANVTGYCNTNFYCSQDYNSANEKYSLNRFFISIPLALILIALGAILFNLDAVGAGLMGGGVGTLIFGISGYWSQANDIFRFFVSVFTLALLIALAYWFNKKFGFKNKSSEKRPNSNKKTSKR